MRIGIFSPYLEGLTGGEKYMLSLASCLSTSHRVEVFWDDNSILQRAEKKFGIDLHNVTVSRNIFSEKFSFFSRFVISKKYDTCIVLSDGSLPIVGSKKLFVHFQFPTEWVRGRGIKNRIKSSRITKVFCNSNFTKKYIDNTFNVKSLVIYPPIETKKLKIDKKNIILTVGRFGTTLEGQNYKKQDVLIQAFKEMVDKGLKDWKFVLVVSVRLEDTEKIETLKKQVAGYPIEFIINPDHDKLIKTYNEAKIYWHASGYGENIEKNPEYAEHFGMSTVEAMSTRVVPVVIGLGGQVEIIEEGKNGFLWNTISELIEKTSLLISDTKLMNKLAMQAEKRAKDFSYEKFCNAVNSLINE